MRSKIRQTSSPSVTKIIPNPLDFFPILQERKRQTMHLHMPTRGIVGPLKLHFPTKREVIPTVLTVFPRGQCTYLPTDSVRTGRWGNCGTGEVSDWVYCYTDLARAAKHQMRYDTLRTRLAEPSAQLFVWRAPCRPTGRRDNIFIFDDDVCGLVWLR